MCLCARLTPLPGNSLVNYTPTRTSAPTPAPAVTYLRWDSRWRGDILVGESAPLGSSRCQTVLRSRYKARRLPTTSVHRLPGFGLIWWGLSNKKEMRQRNLEHLADLLVAEDRRAGDRLHSARSNPVFKEDNIDGNNNNHYDDESAGNEVKNAKFSRCVSTSTFNPDPPP